MFYQLNKYSNYGHVLFVDTTYKLNIEGFPLSVFLVEDVLGCSVSVMYTFVCHETANILQTVVDCFAENNDIRCL